MEIANRYINKPDFFGVGDKDGLGIHEEEYFHVHDCIIDLSSVALKDMDEAFSPTWGAHGLVERCLIRGAGKLILCGCGDDPDEDPKVLREIGKKVVFRDCVLEDFGRRGPEVQDCMEVTMERCLVRNWGIASRFDTRAFGAWAHTGGRIHAEDCIFQQSTFWPGFLPWLKDHWHHFWQCVNERGIIHALFHRDAWLSGYRRGLTASFDGYVEAIHCMATDKRIVIDSHVLSTPMSYQEARALMLELEDMVDRLVGALVGGKREEDA